MKKDNLMKKITHYFLVAAGLLFPTILLASGDAEIVEETKDNTLLISQVIVIIVSVISIGYISWGFYKIEDKNKVVDPDDIGWWNKFLDWLGAHNTEEDVKRLDLHHDYDGIRELDNNIPGWWKAAFAGTILIAVIYFVRFFITDTLPDQVDELKAAQEKAEVEVAKYLERTGGLVDENTAVMSDAAGIKHGAGLYSQQCVACHGASGEGGISPNLADEYWLHNGGIKDVFYSIKYGWPDKGMMPWADVFSPKEIQDIASYILSLQGSNPPNAKDPEGEIYKQD